MSASPERHRSGRATRRRPSDTAGFTLIEVLVAFTVMATILVVLYRGVVTLRQGAESFDDHAARELVARAVLDEALADRTLEAGTHRGLRDGRRWTVVAKPIDLSAQMPRPAEAAAGKPGQPSPPPGAKPPAKLDWTTQRLIVRVESRGRPLELETLRLVRTAP